MAGDWDGVVPERQVRGLRLAVLQDFVLDGLAPQVERDFGRALKALQAAGAVLSDMSYPELREIPTINAKGGIVAAEALFNHRARMAARGAEYDPRVRFRIEAAEAISAADYLDHVARRRAMIALFGQRFEGFDAVLLPTTLNTAPAISELAEDKDYIRLNAMKEHLCRQLPQWLRHLAPDAGTRRGALRTHGHGAMGP